MQHSLNLSKPTILKSSFREISCTKHNPGTYSTRLARIFTFHIDRKGQMSTQYSERFMCQKKNQPIHNKKHATLPKSLETNHSKVAIPRDFMHKTQPRHLKHQTCSYIHVPYRPKVNCQRNIPRDLCARKRINRFIIKKQMQHSLNLSKPTILKSPFREISNDGPISPS